MCKSRRTVRLVVPDGEHQVVLRNEALERARKLKFDLVEVNYLSSEPFNEWILATASSDSTVGLFDIRKLTMPLEEVFQVEWDPNHESVSASSADDRRMMVWDRDLIRIGEEQQEGDADDGPPELLLSDGGHKAKISDISWNKNEPLVISSLAEDKTIHVGQMAENV